MDRLVGPCLSTTTILCGCCSAGDPRRCDAILCEAWPCGTTCPCKAAKPLHLLAGFWWNNYQRQPHLAEVCCVQGPGSKRSETRPYCLKRKQERCSRERRNVPEIDACNVRGDGWTVWGPAGQLASRCFTCDARNVPLAAAYVLLYVWNWREKINEG
ncbi:hypothetical protein SETIT_3G196000v2 [Setaria italica]|uniref:Uncharacterized protein n=1 Tax=Setaria italica TaxID=4555 RepID=A0A368QGN9_SETIT|nr:hypothetical protein SETIT_3G196000v2 [Setaria italica]